MIKGVILIVLVAFSLLITACGSTKGVDVSINEITPINSNSKIEISKPFDLDNIKFDKPREYAIANSQFKMEIEMTNNDDIDYSNVYLKIIKESNLINQISLRSFSGNVFEEVEPNMYKFDSKLFSKQSNRLLLFGEVNDLPFNLTSGQIDLTIAVYQKDGIDYNLIPYSNNPNKIIICKDSSC